MNAAVYSLTNTNDTGSGSIRQAIEDANSTSVKDTIKFNIGNGVQTISLNSQINVTQQIHIDGTSQGGYSGTNFITISTLNGFNLYNYASYSEIVADFNLLDKWF